MDGFFRTFFNNVLLTGLLVAIWHGKVLAEEITFANDITPYCPYTGCDEGKAGYVIDVVRAIFEEEGYTVKIQNVPWNRAIAMVNEGRSDGILGIAKNTFPNLVYPETEVALYVATVFSLARNPWTFYGVESLKKIRLGLIENTGDSEHHTDVTDYLASKSPNISRIATDDALAHIFLMIEAGHVDATVDDLFVGNYTLNKFGKAKQFKSTLLNETTRGYVGFTSKNQKSRHLADVFDAGMIKLRKSGRFKSILARYGLTDWKNQ